MVTDVVDQFADVFGGGVKTVDANVEIEMEKQSDYETQITADFCEETLIQPIQRQESQQEVRIFELFLELTQKNFFG